jgi:hypothetical protein
VRLLLCCACEGSAVSAWQFCAASSTTRSVNEGSVDGGSGRQRGLEVVNNAVSFPVSLFRKLRLQLRASPAWTDDVIGAEALIWKWYADILVQAGRARVAAEALGSSLAASSPGASL